MNWPTSCSTTLAAAHSPISSGWTAYVLTVIAVFLALTASATATVGTTSGWMDSRTTSIDILDQLSPIRSSLSGVQVIPGPFSISPALNFSGENRNIRLPKSSYDKVMALLQSHHDITFLMAVRQEPLNVGTLFSLSEGFTRFLEVQSSGRKDEIRLHYTHLGAPRVETFSHRLADGAWHRLAVTVSGGIATLFVDCRRVERRWMAAVPDTAATANAHESERASNNGDDKLSLWVGQRGQHFHFKGAMQDVRLVAGANGQLAQCPSLEPECPTCGEFHSLRSIVARLEQSLQTLSGKLEVAEARITQLEQCDCPRSCSVNGTVLADGATWQNECQSCSCQKGTVHCSPVQCPATPCRNPVLAPGECCPTCLKKCFFQGAFYEHGDKLNPRPCMECSCSNGSMNCQTLDPKQHCPVLSCPLKDQYIAPGSCCKQCLGVDHCAAGHKCHSRAQCINLQTTYACHCLAGFTGDGRHCNDIDECQMENTTYSHQCGANTVCVNTPGSYRCDCLPGYVHSSSDNYTCVEVDECVTGLHQCHPERTACVKTAGGHECQCRPGYGGPDCQPKCDQPCQHGGLCVAPNKCSCRRGFQGERCELDVDECATGQDECHPNSECRNLPGWYACVCKPGFASTSRDTLHGTRCVDVDECVEGTHTCHGPAHCRNTQGSYECHCPHGHPHCNLSCATQDGLYRNGQTWVPSKSPCHSCHCRDGVVTCSKLPCPSCSSSDVGATAHYNQTMLDQCCPQCHLRTAAESSTCRHQDKPDVVFASGQRWIHQCHSCECLHGETDCWPMECPPVSCSNPVQMPGDCCPRCPDDDPCSVVDLPSTSLDSSAGQGCHYQGLNYTHGKEWAAGLDGCTNCKCKDGKVCCKLDARCAQQRLVGGQQLIRQHPTQKQQHHHHHQQHHQQQNHRKPVRSVRSAFETSDAEELDADGQAQLDTSDTVANDEANTRTIQTDRVREPRLLGLHWRRLSKSQRTASRRHQQK